MHKDKLHQSFAQDTSIADEDAFGHVLADNANLQ